MRKERMVKTQETRQRRLQQPTQILNELVVEVGVSSSQCS